MAGPDSAMTKWANPICLQHCVGYVALFDLCDLPLTQSADEIRERNEANGRQGIVAVTAGGRDRPAQERAQCFRRRSVLLRLRDQRVLVLDQRVAGLAGGIPEADALMGRRARVELGGSVGYGLTRGEHELAGLVL